MRWADESATLKRPLIAFSQGRPFCETGPERAPDNSGL
jgi:hypothetical protein